MMMPGLGRISPPAGPYGKLGRALALLVWAGMLTGLPGCVRLGFGGGADADIMASKNAAETAISREVVKMVKLYRICLQKNVSDKKIMVHILDDINVSIQRYMFTLLSANVLLALLILGRVPVDQFENAGGWAIAPDVLHVISYLGPALIAIATGTVGFMHESVSMALLVSGSSLVISTLVGYS